MERLEIEVRLLLEIIVETCSLVTAEVDASEGGLAGLVSGTAVEIGVSVRESLIRPSDTLLGGTTLCTDASRVLDESDFV